MTCTTPPPAPPPTTILSYGMGVDSTAILLRWLTEPSSRGFDLEDLTVITAMTGNEFEETGALVKTHILPLLRKARVRYVQLARGGRLTGGGITTLDDTRAPEKLYLGGDYTLMDELHHGLTVPQYASGRRRCSQKFKGVVIDGFIEAMLKDTPFRHAMGYAVGEERRAKKDETFATDTRRPFYPLLTWGWDRSMCLDYIAHVTGVSPWPKSCCFYCPFSGGRQAHIERLAGKPALATQALMLEYMALAFNPRQQLFASGKSLERTLRDEGHADLIELRDAKLAALPWQLYRVRRVWKSLSSCWRSVRVIPESRGSMEEVIAALSDVTLDEGEQHKEEDEDMARHPRHRRVFHLKGEREDYPKVEAFLLAAPAAYSEGGEWVVEKERDGFMHLYNEALHGARQQALF